jgi:putative endonuclease
MTEGTGFDRKAIGRKGELLAHSFLTNKKFKIIEHNFTCPIGEIDLICSKDAAYRFIEVKYRRTLSHGLPQESVTPTKQKKIRKTALWWLKQRQLPVDSKIHFDVLAIYNDVRGTLVYNFIEDAF